MCLWMVRVAGCKWCGAFFSTLPQEMKHVGFYFIVVFHGMSVQDYISVILRLTAGLRHETRRRQALPIGINELLA